MSFIEDFSSPSSTQLTDIQEVAFNSFGLVSISSLDSNLERWEVDIERLRQLPFFDALNRFMEEFFTRNLVDNRVSYVIWGGVAANLMLAVIGRSGIHYSFHDVELFLVRDEKIYQPEGLTDALEEDFSSNDQFLLEIGGQSIVKIREGMPVENFQKDRVLLNDGDLYLNNVILIIDRINKKVFVEAPTGTFQALLAGGNTLEMKDMSDLRYIDRIARRIYRNISKSIRFEKVAGLMLSAETKGRLEKLLDSYSKKLDEYFSGSIISLEERKITEEWIANAKIANVESGKRWIFLMTLSETAKRLAGLQGINSLDQVGFIRFLLGEESSATSLFDHPLIQLVQKGLTDPIWPSGFDVRRDIAKRCYSDFFKYQKPGAEKLREAYSLDIVR
jgi:hypothetical protein